MSPFATKIIRSAFGAGERVAPRLAGRAAFALFCRTPNVKRLSAGERRAVERASGFLAEARHHRLKTASGCVMAHEFRPQPGRVRSGTVLVIHGWRSRTEYMQALVEGYRDAGYRVISLDLPGHGQSTGRRLTLVSAIESVRLAADWFGPFTAVVGHSFGGAVAANAVAGSVAGIAPLATERLVLIAAPSSLVAIFEDFGRFINLGRHSYAAMAERVARIAGHPLGHYVAARIADRFVPTLVIHAPDDREVGADHAEGYAAAGDHVRLHWVQGLGHRRILADPGVIAEAVGFVADIGSPAIAA